MATKKPQAKPQGKLAVKQAKPLASTVKTLSTGVTSKQVVKPTPGKPSEKIAVKTTETTTRKVEVKPEPASTAKPDIKKAVASKPPAKTAAKLKHKSAVATKLVHTNELTAQALHADTTPPWDVQPVAAETGMYVSRDPEPMSRPAAPPVMQRREYDRPVSIKAPASHTQGLSMSQIRSNLAHSVPGAVQLPVQTSTADRDTGAPYLRAEPVKTSRGISVKDVLRHIAQGPWVNQQR